MRPGPRWDIFCTVIDNYGDIGITWRLARQLVTEYALQVRLWVDDLESFRHIRPEIDPGLDCQVCSGVDIRRWRSPLPEVEPADVVIEALACHLPEQYEKAMAEQAVKPLWLNLEYLSAEAWVAGCHALPSPHPRLALTKYFFMPGYVAGTGGVLKESWLIRERDAFQADVQARNEFWRALAVPVERPGELRVSLFSYESQAIESLFQAWAEGTQPVRCLVPEGKPLLNVARFFGRTALAPGAVLDRRALTVHVLPMLDQDRYDRLLWACDCNLVRGEDSLVRAMWAGKAMVWQAYRQEEGAHWPKIDALLDLYCSGMAEAMAEALRRLWQTWNEDGAAGPAWAPFWAYREQWLMRSAAWQTSLDEVDDLAGNLVKFCNEKSK
ncbi:MAG: elongation factor P maturation arginine rhamnosyltransferase EarP [Gallionellaceae bacterium]|nr:elongation factor P maturation arginine rhamnosyltransferase EarP [Gallionellaceae bacterium]